ncbi:MAG: PCYCGC motif-containing (lipo)protein [Methanobacteriota archaeon]
MDMVKPKRVAKKEKPNYAFIFFTIFIFVSAVAAYALLSGGSMGARQKSSIPLPDYAYRNQKTFEAYTIATKIPEVLEKLPCYCGCKSLLGCFLDGEGRFTERAVYCDACINEALDAYKWYIDGLSLNEIRQRMDEKYGSNTSR